MALDPYFVKEFRVPDCISIYHAQWHDWIWLEEATAVMLEKQQIIAPEQKTAIVNALNEIEAKTSVDDMDGNKTDVYSNLTDLLCEAVGPDTGNLLHQGRSRNDMNCTCDRMQTRRFILNMCDYIADLTEQVLKKAEEEKETIITYYTYGQPSQPGTFGHYLTMFTEQMNRSFKRFQAAYDNTNMSPLGHATGIGTQVKLDPSLSAKLLGFDGVIRHSLDAISSPDFLIETEAAVVILMNDLDRVAQDLLFWASYESGLFDLSPSISGNSSIMPQKKNPAAIPLMRGCTGKAGTMLFDTLNLLRNTTQFSINELWVDIFTELDNYLEEFRRAMETLTLIFNNTRIRREKSYSYTANNFTGASTAAEVLSEEYGVPFTETHHIIGGMIRELMNRDALDVNNLTGKMLAEYSAKIMKEPIIMTDGEVKKLFDPMFGINKKTTGGTPRSEDFDVMMKDYLETLEKEKQWIKSKQNHLADMRKLCEE